jgi:hypothetical protein
LKAKAIIIINEINAISKSFKVTAEHFSEGIFPWDSAHDGKWCI